jgi:hypothetical protein
MSDHIDGPRSIGEPAADLTDLFAFTSPENSVVGLDDESPGGRLSGERPDLGRALSRRR